MESLTGNLQTLCAELQALIATGRNGKSKSSGGTEVETAWEAEGNGSASLCFGDPLHLARPACLIKR